MPKLYDHLAPWFHHLTAPEEYAEEAALLRRILEDQCDGPPRTLLELGSGGGNNASHLKAHFELTLVDLSPPMLDLSRGLNPECEHLEGDMRNVRLGRTFDSVLIHDAIVYLTTEAELAAALRTAFVHCRPGGSAVFAPDETRETFECGTKHGGHDRHGRGLRYLEWGWDPDPEDTSYRTAFALILREADGTVRVESDEHECGVFPRTTWLRILDEVGFDGVRAVPDPWGRELFACRRPRTVASSPTEPSSSRR